MLVPERKLPMNKFTKKQNVAVFFGGCSSEYGVSLKSASAVIRNLDRSRYEPVLVGISQKGDWFYYDGPVEAIEDDRWLNSTYCVPALLSPDRGHHHLLIFRDNAAEALPVDIAFPVLHGKNGEDGTIQGLIEMAGIPLAGCSVLSSALCMDKDRAHRLVASAGVRVPRAMAASLTTPFLRISEFAKELGFPLFVKPLKAGSSYGVARVTSDEGLREAVKLAFLYDNEIIIEENIEGFEVGCSVLGCEELTVGAVDEIELSGGFFDFTEKYTLKTSAIHVPARISQEKAQEIKETAKVIYRALGCSVFARVDMFLTPEGEIVFNEVNTIPGFTEHSRYPGMMKTAGIPFPALVTKILEQAVTL